MQIEFKGNFISNLVILIVLSIGQACAQISTQSFADTLDTCFNVEAIQTSKNELGETYQHYVNPVENLLKKNILFSTKFSARLQVYEDLIQKSGFGTKVNQTSHWKNIPQPNFFALWKNELSADLDLSGPCNIEKISKESIDEQKFLKLYAYDKPVIIVNATDNKEFQKITRLDNLLRIYGQSKIKLSSANSFSYENKIVTFEEYCAVHLLPQSLSSLGNETYYFFGDNSNEAWSDLLESYHFPSYFLPGHFPQGSFGIAGPGSGVPFHFHGPGFAETIWGRKRWFMYPPASIPFFHPNRTTLQWLYEEYPKARLDSNFLECTLNPGELIYFPDHWWHATLNVDIAVFMSTFLSSYGP